MQQQKENHGLHKPVKMLILAAALLPLLHGTDAQARPRHHKAHAARSACDGFHRCRCGVTAARLHGLPLNYNGHNLKQAASWPRAFPRAAAPAPDMVVYQHGGGPTGHVSTIKSVISRCQAVVHDDAGTYERDICTRGAVILSVSG